VLSNGVPWHGTSGQGLSKTLIDQWMMIISDAVVVTAGSTFGANAAMLNGRLPFYVTWNDRVHLKLSVVLFCFVCASSSHFELLSIRNVELRIWQCRLQDTNTRPLPFESPHLYQNTILILYLSLHRRMKI
jgi:hypothetical protein